MNPKQCLICKVKMIFDIHDAHRYVCSECFESLSTQLDSNLLAIIEEELRLRNTIVNVIHNFTPNHNVLTIIMRQPFRGDYVSNQAYNHYVSKQIKGEQKYKEEIFAVTSTVDKKKSSVCHVHVIPIDTGMYGEPDLTCWAELFLRVIYLIIFNLAAPFLLGYAFQDVDLAFRITGCILISFAVFFLTLSNVQDTGIRKWQESRRQIRDKAVKKARKEWLR
ncbi:hypothetical protein PD716_14185 [Vibrio gigantis]|uniref:hypothetical protein n=1 Tax=Vibrio gigantis TaxID=296199 RepID=UPI002FC7FBD5